MKIYENILKKGHSFPIEEIPICTDEAEAIATLKTKLYLKTSNNQNIQNIAHHASQNWTIFVINKRSKQKHSKVTG